MPLATIANKKQKLSASDAEFIIDTYRPIPHLFASDVLGATPWEKQIEIITAVFNYREVAVKTCNAVGKSYIAARIIVSFLMLYPGSTVVTTAPTWRQVRDILWREIRTTVGQCRYVLTEKTVNQTGIEIATDWFAIGLSAKEPEKFFGYHSDFILVVVDEAGGVPEPIFKGVKAITPNANAHVLYIGNPTNPSGTFFNAFQPGSRAKQFTISAFDTPNFKQAGIANVEDLIRIFTPPDGVAPEDHDPFPNGFEWVYPRLISPVAAYERFLEWGTDSPMWQSLVMGEFPSAAINALIPLDLIQAAMNYEPGKPSTMPEDQMTGDQRLARLDWDKNYKWEVQEGHLQYGIDIARYGNDRTVMAPRRGGFVDPLIVWGRKDTAETTDIILNTINKSDATLVLHTDDSGVGGGVTDQLNRRLSDNNNSGKNELWYYQVDPINVGSAAFDDKRFFNRRSEVYWNLREQFMQRKISLPLDLKLANELACIQYSYTIKDNKIKIESKDDIKKRLGFSPDLADALTLAFAPSGVGTFDEGNRSARAVAQAVSQQARRVVTNPDHPIAEEHPDPDAHQYDDSMETAGMMSKTF
jgi:phage terminase large subunit